MSIPTTRGIRRLARFASVAFCAAALSLRAAEVARFVAYIQTDGRGSTVGEYVLLDYKPTAASFVEMDIMFLSQSANQTLFCARGGKTTSSTFTLFHLPGNGFRWDYNRTSAQYESGFGVNERHVIRCGPTGFWTDGVQSTTIKISPQSYTPANKMTLFASYTASTTATPVPDDNWANLRLYSFKAWDDNGETLKVHLRPCVDIAGVAGLYDVVSGKIYYNKRSGKAFTVSDTDAPDTLLITGGPVAHGSPSPGYGPVVELGTGDSIVATCPAAWTNADETIAATCTGWKLYDAAGTVVSNGVGNAFTYVHPGAARRLEWQLDVRYKVRAEADAGGAAAPAEQWVAHGGSATVAATPDSGFVFQKWTEANTGAAYEANPLGVSAVTNLILTAHFGNITNIFVAPEGRGEMTGASWSNALGGSGTGYSVDLKAAIEGAIAEGAGEVNVRFAGGDYPTPAQLALSSLTVPIRFCGGYAAEADGSLEMGDTATTLTSTNGAARLLAAGNLPSFTIQGITFSNCAFANSSGAAYGGALHLSSCTTSISNCVFTGNSTKSKSNAQSCGGAIYLTGGSLAIADCEFRSNRATCNGSNGFERGGALCTLNASLSVSGCTFTGNNASGRDSVLSGGAINVNGGDAAITNCTFTQNYAQCYRGGQANGGALSIRSATRFTMSDSVLERNYCATAAYVTPEIAGCYFDDFNAADGVMTAVVTRCVFDSRSLPSSEYKTKSDILLNGGRLTLANCLIAGASGTHSTMTNSVRVQRCASELPDLKDPVSGSKSPIDVCELELVNVTIADGAGAGVVRVGEDADLSLRNCIVHGNAVAGVVNPSSISYSCVQEAQDGVGNFVADPHWTGAPYYHLLTKRAGGAITNGWFSGTFDSPKTEKDSPCLDAGAPDSAGLPLEPKPHGPRVNLGAYGGTPWATRTLAPPGLRFFVR